MTKLFKNILINLERTIQNLKTKDAEFIYSDTNSIVPPNKQYSIYYGKDKNELYFTGLSTSKYPRQIRRQLNNTMYSEYQKVKGGVREIYPKTYTPKLNEEEYNRGFINRYFIQKANDVNSPVLEISETDYNKTLNLFKKTKIIWFISGRKDDVGAANYEIIRREAVNYKNIKNLLYPLQYWKPKKDSVDDLQKKLSLLKKT